MKLPTELYSIQAARWPKEGRHILAHFDEASIVIYQAYRHSIADHAVRSGSLGGLDFSFSRMSWVKPNFLWMMYRSGWGVKEGQERTLALRISRAFFESILEQAVPSSFNPELFREHAEWKRAVEGSDVRLQWDPDHAPTGAPLERRAIQLGLRGSALQSFAKRELIEVVDLTEFVETQRALIRSNDLRTPLEHAYVPQSPLAQARVRLSA